jgi:hypothetical protein
MLLSRGALVLVLALLLTPTLLNAANPTPKPQEVFAPYWTAEPGWETELQLKNNLTAGPLTVTPVLRLASGQEIALDPVTIASNASVSVWVNEALLKRSAEFLSQPGSYGSVAFRFTSRNPRNLYAAIVLSLYGTPIGFRINAYPTAGSEAWSHAALAGSREGIWWRPRRAQNDVLILSSSSEKTLAGTLWLSDAGGKRWSQRLSLLPHQTRRLNVRELVSAAGLPGQYGGIQFEVPSYAGALDSVHFMYDETIRHSALLEMFSRDPSATLRERTGSDARWTLWAPMLALRSPDPVLGLPSRTVLQPTIFVRNTTAKKVSASITLSWRGDSGRGRVNLPELQLAPFATQQLQIGTMQKQLGIPDDAHWALVTLTSPASPDDLIAIASSSDGSGRYNLETRFSDNLGSRFVGGEWQADATHNVLAAVTNGGKRSTEALLTLHYDDGKKKYEMQQTIQAGDQMWVNFADLIHNRVPDRKGNVLPADLIFGTYDLQDLDPGPGNLMQGDLALDGTWGHHFKVGSPTCCGEYDPGWNPSFAPVDVGGELYINILAPDCHGVEQDVSNDFTTWSSDDSQVAQVTPRKVQGVSSGFTNGWAYGKLYEGSGTNCAWVDAQAGAPVYVGPQIFWGTARITGTTQSAVVGQQIALSYSYTPPAGVTVQSQSWTVAAGTPVGGYNATSNSGAVVAANFSGTSTTFYWAYPSPQGSPFKVIITVNLSDGTHQAGFASFNLIGPTGGTMTVTPYPRLTMNDMAACVIGGKNIPAGPWLNYGNLAGSCSAPTGTAGILFNNPTGYSGSSGGSFSLVQLTSSFVLTGGFNHTYSVGLDTQYPYGSPPNEDSPGTGALLPPDTTQTLAFNANMFLMWQSNTANSIPVPLGYQTWAVSGSATCTTSCGSASNWTPTTNGKPGPVGSFTASSASQTKVGNNVLQYGYPTWTGISQ